MWGLTEVNGALNEPGINLGMGNVNRRARVLGALRGQKMTSVFTIYLGWNMNFCEII